MLRARPPSRARPISLVAPKRELPSLPRRHPSIGGGARRSGKRAWKPRRESSSRSLPRPRWFFESVIAAHCGLTTAAAARNSLEFYAAMHNIHGLGIRRLLEG